MTITMDPYIGQTIGKYKIIKTVPKPEYLKRRNKYYKVQCIKCKQFFILPLDTIKTSNPNSECTHNSNHISPEKMIGQTYGSLRIIDIVSKYKSTGAAIIKVQCLVCGLYFDLTIGELKGYNQDGLCHHRFKSQELYKIFQDISNTYKEYSHWKENWEKWYYKFNIYAHTHGYYRGCWYKINESKFGKISIKPNMNCIKFSPDYNKK